MATENEFAKFQLEEYKNISSAHFESNKQIGIFFRYFLLIASAPAVIFIWFGNNDKIISELITGKVFEKSLFVGFFLILISIIGIFACFYLISFRLDSILYARTVNGIRKYFYTHQKSKIENQYRVLPKQTNVPEYKQRHTFSIIVYCFALINSIYFAAGTKIIAGVGGTFFTNLFPIEIPIIIDNYNFTWTIICAIFIFILHIFYYNFITSYRNYSYMKNLTIGIDIDGVLNLHRKTFCSYLEKYTNIKLDPEAITNIPVHTIPGIKESLGLERKHEFKVFNEPDYWLNQKLIDAKVSLIIKELRDVFGYRIHIFSFRAWPDTSYLDINDSKSKYLKKWWYYDIKNFKIILIPFFKYLFNPRFLVKSRIRIIKYLHFKLPFFRIISKTKIYSRSYKFYTIHRITRRWLRHNKIQYNKLTIEKSSIDVKSVKLGLFSIPKNNFKNRFYYSHKKAFRYFIEDDIKNAIKLCASCEYVFLIEHPYNRIDKIEPENIPSNLIPVKSWSEIKEKIRELG